MKTQLICLLILSVGCNSGDPPAKSESSMNDPDKAAEQVLSTIMSTPEGRSEVERLGGKDNALSAFQVENGISERIAEAAIKEWVLTHNNSFDWDLEDVKTICIRNRDQGIPRDYLPESEKR